MVSLANLDLNDTDWKEDWTSRLLDEGGTYVALLDISYEGYAAARHAAIEGWKSEKLGGYACGRAGHHCYWFDGGYDHYKKYDILVNDCHVKRRTKVEYPYYHGPEYPPQSTQDALNQCLQSYRDTIDSQLARLKGQIADIKKIVNFRVAARFIKKDLESYKWEAEFEKLTTIVQPYLHEPAVGAKFAETQELMDVLYQCEDVRDHLNELAELATRASGLMGTGYNAGEKVENMAENAQACAAAYEALLAKHPNFKPKIEQTVGHGLAVLRQKHKFNWSTMYRYFF